MGKNTSFSLGDHFSAFVEAKVAEGRYASASEEQEAKLAALRAALIDGETSGASTPFDFDAFVARKRGLTTPLP
jgi:antitoxin ParD1/3/4